MIVEDLLWSYHIAMSSRFPRLPVSEAPFRLPPAWPHEGSNDTGILKDIVNQAKDLLLLLLLNEASTFTIVI